MCRNQLTSHPCTNTLFQGDWKARGSLVILDTDIFYVQQEAKRGRELRLSVKEAEQLKTPSMNTNRRGAKEIAIHVVPVPDH